MLLHEWPRVGPAAVPRVCGVLAALVALGCHESVTAVPVTHATVNAARGVDTHSRANLVWQDAVDVGTANAPNIVPAGIRGDGRNKKGEVAVPANEYQGDYCGVRAFIYDQRGEDGNLNPDPDTYYTSAMDTTTCRGGRKLALYLAGADSTPVMTGPMFLIDAIWKLGLGAVVVQPMDFGVQDNTSSCRFSFNAAYTGASNVRLSRLVDVQVGMVTARQWRLETQGTHKAACLATQPNGRYVDTGTRYKLPFAVTITQVPYPYTTYPP